jgi:hypothetical protein
VAPQVPKFYSVSSISGFLAEECGTAPEARVRRRSVDDESTVMEGRISEQIVH